MKNDMISRQAAIDAMINSRSNADVTLVPSSYTNGWRDGRKLLLDDLLQVVFELPSVQPEITNEEIRFALKQLKTYLLIKIRDKKDGDVPVELLQRIEEIQEYVGNLPSIQPETCDTCKHGYFGDDCENCCVGYPNRYERRTDD